MTMKTVENFALYQLIGEGQYGKVYLTQLKDPNVKSKTMRPIKKGRVAACKMISTNIQRQNK